MRNLRMGVGSDYIRYPAGDAWRRLGSVGRQVFRGARVGTPLGDPRIPGPVLGHQLAAEVRLTNPDMTATVAPIIEKGTP